MYNIGGHPDPPAPQKKSIIIYHGNFFSVVSQQNFQGLFGFLQELKHHLE